MTTKRWLIRLLLSALITTIVYAQNPDQDKAHREVMELLKQQRLLDALPLLEQTVAANPNDAEIKGWLAYVLLVQATTVNDPAVRARVRMRARVLALEAQQNGNRNDLVGLAAELPADGRDEPFSDKAGAEAAMQAGESAFATRDFDRAISAYTRALLLDPKAYHAALFLGDVYFTKRELGSAGQWFARAIEIDPNIETAYRYWGDSLAAMSQNDEARSKYIEAIIAEPYNRSAWRGVSQWAQINKLNIRQPQLDIPVHSETKDDGKVNVTVDSSSLVSNDGSALWIAYEFSRLLWKREKFSKEFPSEKTYRHTLREESESLRLVAETMNRQLKAGELKSPNPQLLTLAELSNSYLLEPFILLSRADEGIAQDYAAYRSQHREKLREYLDKYVVPKKISSRAD